MSTTVQPHYITGVTPLISNLNLNSAKKEKDNQKLTTLTRRNNQTDKNFQVGQRKWLTAKTADNKTM